MATRCDARNYSIGVGLAASGPLVTAELASAMVLAFLSAPQRVLGREQLLDRSRLHNAEVYDRSIDVQVGRLRRKIEVDAKAPQLLLTERGAGYLFRAPVEVIRG